MKRILRELQRSSPSFIKVENLWIDRGIKLDKILRGYKGNVQFFAVPVAGPVRAVIEILLLCLYMDSISLISPRLMSTGLKSSAESRESVLA